MPTRIDAATFLAFALAMLASVGAGARARNDQERRVERQLPSAWVGFSADFLQGAPHYPGRDHGKLWRRSDGSERNEIHQGLALGVMIKNIPQNTFYRRIGGPGKPWTANPMQLTPEGWHPEPVLYQAPNIVLSDEKFEGMDTYRFTSLKGDVLALNVPELNFFRVAGSFPGGKWVRFSNIVRGEPDASLFEPPPGEFVKHRSEPDGIVFSREEPEVAR